MEVRGRHPLCWCCGKKLLSAKWIGDANPVLLLNGFLASLISAYLLLVAFVVCYALLSDQDISAENLGSFCNEVQVLGVSFSTAHALKICTSFVPRVRLSFCDFSLECR